MLFTGLVIISVAGCTESSPSNAAEATNPGFVSVQAEHRKHAPQAVLDALGDRLSVEAVFALSSSHPDFGGLSGLWLNADATRMIAINDSNQRWQARLVHDDKGRLTDVVDWSVADLPQMPGEDDALRWIDSESLSGDGGGGLVVAYEGNHRLRRWSLDHLDDIPESVTLPEGLGGPSNSGIEALATLPGGRLFAVGERVGAWGGEGLMGWVIDGRSVEDLIYIQGPGFAPTGADRLDDRMFMVERSFSLLGGFRSRIVTFPADAVRPKARIEGDELAAFRWGSLGENFEAIAARRGPNGRIMLYLLADDNFSFLQETLLVQLSLPASGPVQ